MSGAAYRKVTARSIAFAPLIDALLISLAGWLAYYTRWNTWSLPLDYLSVLVLGIGLVLVIFPLTGAYRSWSGRLHWQRTGNALPGLFTVTVLLMIAGTLTKTSAEFSRLWMGYWFLYAIAALYLCRWVTTAGFSRLAGRRSPVVKILLVGDGHFADSVAQRARDADDANWIIIGAVSLDPEYSGPTPSGIPRISLESMEGMIAEPSNEVDEVWIAMDNHSVEQKQRVIRLLHGSCLRVRYVPDLSMLALLNHVIKLDSRGPVFFRQQRHGWDGKVFNVLKFRSMRHDVPQTDTQQARRDDPRVTRVGRILRRYSIDELPQFINVLLGDMSVVGPRPHPLSLNRDFGSRIDAYMQRHRVRPGITGWAQIHGLRGETETLEKMQLRVSYDLYYIEHWSLWLDAKIIALTLIRGWRGGNVY